MCNIRISQKSDGIIKSGFIAAVLVSLFLLQGCVPPPRGTTSKAMAPPRQENKAEKYYAGYSKKYIPLRQNLAAGKVDDVQRLLDEEEKNIMATAKTETELVDQLRLVGLMERASLCLQTGKSAEAINYCRQGQELIEARASESYSKEGLSTLGTFLTTAVGAGEFGRYTPPGYEKVLLLDIASMAYLLQGDDRAFNVARLAIQWQDEEKDRFGKELENITQENTNSTNTEGTGPGGRKQTEKLLAAEFAKYDNIALTVPNAFVNPFGDYVTGMINEFKSIEKASLLSNAHIAYKQALTLNPESKVLQQAVKDTEEKKPATRLIHVVALDGFAPEKKVLSVPIEENFDVELPSYDPIPSKVSKITVTTATGKMLATLSPVANIEALALRHQKDSLPGMFAMVLTTVLRDIAIAKLGDAVLPGLGGLVKDATDTVMEPDTTSWMSLPSNILAARFYPPKGTDKLIIHSYNESGKLLSEKTIKLSEGDRHFVLVRSIDETMYAYPSKKIWSTKLLTNSNQ